MFPHHPTLLPQLVFSLHFSTYLGFFVCLWKGFSFMSSPSLLPILSITSLQISENHSRWLSNISSHLLVLWYALHNPPNLTSYTKMAVVSDGRSSNNFKKMWASIFRSNGDLSCLGNSLPLHNRDVISDANGLEEIFLDQWWTSRSHFNPDMAVNNHDFKDQVRATILLSQHVINRLKHWISKQIMENNIDPKSPYISAFVAICAFVWVCLIKSQSSISHHSDRPSFDKDEPWHFCFVADCRNRYEFSLVPETYFGNCLAICFVSAERGDLVGKNGMSIAAKAIGSRIMELSTGALKGAEKWILKWQELSGGHLVTVAGSPKLSVYDTDFGWGKPKKSEVVQIDVSGAISLAESRDEKGGVEVGLALSRAEMGAFSTLFKEGLENLF